IDKTLPGSAVEPAYPAIPRDERLRTVELHTPEVSPFEGADESGAGAEGAGEGPIDPPTIESVYGIRLAPTGQVDQDAVTIQVVYPESLGAVAGLQTGDILERINGGPITTAAHVDHYLLNYVTWGEPLKVEI